MPVSAVLGAPGKGGTKWLLQTKSLSAAGTTNSTVETGEAVTNLFADDIVFYIPGCSQQSGDFSGRKGIAIYFSKVGELSGGTHRLEIHDVLANDEHVTALLRANG